MANGYFAFENDLLKHYVRTHGWLPSCRRRLMAIRRQDPRNPRRLRYFTFCAAGAVDVLMLDVAKVIRRSSTDKFDTVVFFDRTPEAVSETQKNIPGAIGFPGDFTGVVLLEDPDEENVGNDDPLRTNVGEQDTAQTRGKQVVRSQRRMFVQQFPFDVVNLDLEEFLLKPNDPIPGRVVNSLRKILQWQRNPVIGSNRSLDAFALMFTTQIGPPNLGDDYLTMLEGYLRRNLEDDPALAVVLMQRTGVDDPGILRTRDFSEFFRLAMPKIIACIALEEDWFIDPDHGITIYEFERPSESGPYRMLHLVMDVKRQTPPRAGRPPGERAVNVEEAYRTVVRGIFENAQIAVSDETIDPDTLREDLDKIFARRRKYLHEVE